MGMYTKDNWCQMKLNSFKTFILSKKETYQSKHYQDAIASATTVRTAIPVERHSHLPTMSCLLSLTFIVECLMKFRRVKTCHAGYSSVDIMKMWDTQILGLLWYWSLFYLPGYLRQLSISRIDVICYLEFFSLILFVWIGNRYQYELFEYVVYHIMS